MPPTISSEERLLNAAKSIPATPRIMARLHALLLDANSGLEEIARLLKCDVALTSRIIRIANSAAYKGRGVGSVEDALQRVGFGEVFRLVGLATNAGLAERELRCYGYAAKTFQTHNLMMGLVAEGIAGLTGQDTRLAYTAGLFRRIGRLLLDRVGQEWMTDAETFPETQEILEAWERKMFGCTHREVGRMLLRHWNFPETVVHGVAHDPTREVPTTTLAQQLCLAEHVVRAAGCGLPGEPLPPEPLFKELTLAGLSSDDADVIREQALAAMEKLGSAH